MFTISPPEKHVLTNIPYPKVCRLCGKKFKKKDIRYCYPEDSHEGLCNECFKLEILKGISEYILKDLDGILSSMAEINIKLANAVND